MKLPTKVRVKCSHFMRFGISILGSVLTDEADTDLETDRLLGQQRTDDQGFYDDKVCTLMYRRV